VTDLTDSSGGFDLGGVGGRAPGKLRIVSLYRVGMAVWFFTEICLVGLLPSGTSEPKSMTLSLTEPLQIFNGIACCVKH